MPSRLRLPSNPAGWILAASLAANVALLALWLQHEASALVAARPPARAGADSVASAAAATAEQKHAALLTALAAGDTAALKAAGVSEEVIRHLAAARAFGRLVALQRREETTAVVGEFWRTRRSSTNSTALQIERRTAEHDLERALREAFGDGWMGGGGNGTYAFLPLDKQEKLHRIERDYEEMEQEISFSNHGIELAADRQKRELLNAEKARDIAAVLTPTERAQVERRSSSAAQEVINRYGDVIASEEEFSRLEALQLEFIQRVNAPDRAGRPRSPEENRARADAEARLNDNIRAMLGEDRWAARDPNAGAEEAEIMRALTTRLGLGATAADGIFAMRDNYAAQSVAIQQNSLLSAAERRTQLTQLAGRARDELGTRLGPDGAEAYAQSAGWLQTLQRGGAFTTDPRQLPPGSPRPGNNVTWFAVPAPKG